MHPGTVALDESIAEFRTQSSAMLRRGSMPWWRGCGALALLPALTWWLCTALAAPRWVLMWSFAYAVYLSCKWLTWRRTPVEGAPLWKHAAYLLAWPGMDAAAFLSGK